MTWKILNHIEASLRESRIVKGYHHSVQATEKGIRVTHYFDHTQIKTKSSLNRWERLRTKLMEKGVTVDEKPAEGKNHVELTHEIPLNPGKIKNAIAKNPGKTWIEKLTWLTEQTSN